MNVGVVLETPRLALRDLRDSDFERVYAYATDNEVVRYLDWGPNSVEDTTRFLTLARKARESSPRTAYHLAIALRTDDRAVGGCRIEIRDAATEAGDLGYVLDRAHWGHGYATEAGRALLAFGFEGLGLHRIWTRCDIRNIASARVLEKLGMRREGLLRHDVRRKGEWHDSYLYAILEPEWHASPPGPHSSLPRERLR